MSATLPHVNFHVLKTDQEHYYLYLTSLTEKLYRQGSALLIYTATADESIYVDQLLWSYRDTSFLPHHILTANPLPAPILISHTLACDHAEVLINLSNDIPRFYAQFQRIIEIIYADEKVKKRGRQKYRKYQQLACKIDTSFLESVPL